MPERGRNRIGRPEIICRYVIVITGKPIEDLLEIAVNKED